MCENAQRFFTVETEVCRPTLRRFFTMSHVLVTALSVDMQRSCSAQGLWRVPASPNENTLRMHCVAVLESILASTEWGASNVHYLSEVAVI